MHRFSVDFQVTMDGFIASMRETNAALEDLGRVMSDLEMSGALEDAVVPEGRVVFRGQPSYWGKECLKKLGGYWDPPHKRWLVPEANKEMAQECLRFAKAMGRLLTPEEAEEHIAAVREALGVRRVVMQRVVCYECGKTFTIQQMLERGGVPADWYCGCCEERNLPRRLPFGGRA